MKDAIVLDAGAGSIKAGFAGEDVPRSVFPSMVGRHKKFPLFPLSNNPHDEETMLKKVYVGDVANNIRGMLKVTCPIIRGSVYSWFDMEEILHHTYRNELRVASEDHAIMLTEAPFNRDRKKMIQMFFEAFNVPAISAYSQAALSLYASGRHTGCVIDSGYEASYAVPFLGGYREGHCLKDRMTCSRFAGRFITESIVNSFMKRGILSGESSWILREIARDIKETVGYVALDYEEEMRNAKASSRPSETYTLPDGNQVHVGSACFRCPEILFNPQLAGSKSTGIHSLVCSSLWSVDDDWRTYLFRNIVLSGGNTLLKGMAKRMQKEVQKEVSIYARSFDVKVIAPSNRKVRHTRHTIPPLPRCVVLITSK